tara:strand:+ start:24443 stop:24742 length:300 start_codon:yes stop_codon:yes gene_type:complete
MTKLQSLNLFEEFLRADLQLTIEDFFSVSVDTRAVSLQWNGRNKTYTFSELVARLDGVSKFSYVSDYKCEWNKDHHWFEIEFTMDASNEGKYGVRIIIH